MSLLHVNILISHTSRRET